MHLKARCTTVKILSFWSNFWADSWKAWHLRTHRKWFPPRFHISACHRCLYSYLMRFPRSGLMSGGEPATVHMKWTSHRLRKSVLTQLGKIWKVQLWKAPDHSEIAFSTNSHPSTNRCGSHSTISVFVSFKGVTLCVFLMSVETRCLTLREFQQSQVSKM